MKRVKQIDDNRRVLKTIAQTNLGIRLGEWHPLSGGDFALSCIRILTAAYHSEQIRKINRHITDLQRCNPLPVIRFELV